MKLREAKGAMKVNDDVVFVLETISLFNLISGENFHNISPERSQTEMVDRTSDFFWFGLV